jgi:hypothetical protein
MSKCKHVRHVRWMSETCKICETCLSQGDDVSDMVKIKNKKENET